MVQGKSRLKKLPNGIKTKNKKQNKPLGLKKGGQVIAPKKKRHLEAAKLKKGLEKSINAKIEHEVTMTANSVEPKSFHVVKSQHAQEASTSKANKT
ncbi:Hypothetical predicted protein [Mytilus galloprovincialis]|uniref:Leydig cell tumor 10 kDa protein n=1 Tax=Mytilus galloprovincialis TaxID=29158 RepID=A0A8B6FEQ6_MYTGA|nr:Hypothetical predicted protein [Mytilus galloprovincialis]